MRKVDANVSFPKLEEEVLRYWDKHRIFEKSVSNREGQERYSFYDGPPFATGLPHYGHLVPGAVKDAVPRYFTMRGYQVERRWGWDCHGLPIENIAEKERGFSTKKEIVAYGVEKFNEFCRGKVLEYAEEWKRYMHRFGRWADMEHAYRTMDRDYMESVWWVFKELWDQGLIYESYRSMYICPRCETTLSQQEVSEGYADVKDLSVIAKFQLVDEPGIFLLAWTTTPWTLPGNVALAVNPETEYSLWQVTRFERKNYELSEGKKEAYIIATDLAGKIFGVEDLKPGLVGGSGPNDPQTQYEILGKFPGSKLIGQAYKPLFDYYSADETLENRERGWKVYGAEFVNTEEGTGIVHIAPAFGEDDMALGKRENLPWVQHVKTDGTMKEEVTDFAGKPVKPKEDPQAMDVEIIKYLANHGTLFSKEKYEHSYPHCWRCDTPLLNYATSSWFVAVEKIKDQLLANAEDIRWSPDHLKRGRFGKWLEGARDWSISRQRFWASVLPLWRCECGEIRVFGSVADLEEASGQPVTDLHKHVVDQVTFPCEKCEGVMKRVPDVLDTWFDSGSMPYAQLHYPFEHEEKFKSAFPADFIAEGVDQTRAWFYYLHVLATALKDKPAFRNAIVNGTVLAADGKKMSKKLKNYPDPLAIIEKYGSDALRFYLLSSPVVAAENLSFSEKDLADITRNTFRMLWNSYSFFTTYATIDRWSPRESGQPENILDRWILSELQLLVQEVTDAMERYEMTRAVRAFPPFIDNLSNWYIRRSRKRFWKNENDSDKEGAYQTLYEVLVEVTKLLAPFTPFLAEEMYRNLTDEESVHLADWPEIRKKLIDEKLSEEMARARAIVTAGLKWRTEAKLKVRQPLASVMAPALSVPLQEIVLEELNVKTYQVHSEETVVLDGTLTPALKLEGEAREIIRAIQEGRKKAGFNVEDRIILAYQGKEEVMQQFDAEIAREVLATAVELGELIDPEYAETLDIEGETYSFTLKRV